MRIGSQYYYVLCLNCLFSYLLLSSHAANAQDLWLPKIPLSHVFETDDYGGGMQNWRISEGKNGFLYVANNFGLLEFDGDRWSLYEIPKNTKTRSICIGSLSDRIYVGGQNSIGYFEADSLGHLAYQDLLPLIPRDKRSFDDVWDIIEVNDKIIFSTIYNLFIYDGTSIKVIDVDEAIGFSFKVDNQVFSFSENLGLLQLVKGQLKVISQQTQPIKDVHGIIKDKTSGYLLFTAYNGVYSFDNNILTPVFTDLIDLFRGAIINTVILLSTGDIAVGTQNNGLIILSPAGKIKYHLNKGSGLSNRTVLSLYEDRFKNLWVGLNNGINYLELNSPFSILDERSNLPGTGYDAIKYQQKVYFGTSNGLHYLDQNKAPFKSSIDLVENSEGQVYDLSIVSGELYLAHHEGGFYIDNNKANQFFGDNGAWKYASIPTSNLLLGGTYNGFHLFNKPNLPQNKNYTKIKGLNESSRVFEIDQEGDIWMTHGYKGIYRLNFPQGYESDPFISYYGVNSGLPSNLLNNVFKIDGNLVFTTENGVYQYHQNTDKFVSNQKLTNLIGQNKHVSFLQEDSFGNIYFIASEEIGVLQKTTRGQYKKNTKAFNKVNKLISDDLENISILDYQNILIGARDGFIHYNPQRNTGFINKPDALIKRIEVKGDTLLSFQKSNFAEKIAFDSHFNDFIFHFASPNYPSIDHISYAYKLEGFDEEWSSFDLQNSKEYTNLSPGDYTFKLISKDIYGLTSDEVHFDFTVLPPWYRTTLAYGAYTLFAFGLFGLSLFTLDRRHRVHRKKTEIDQKLQLQTKEDQLQQVTKKSEERIAELRNENLKVEINHKNKELATTTMHLLEKNEFMNGVKLRLKNALDSGKESKKEIRDAIREIEKNIAHQEDWKHFEMHFDVVHREFLKKIKDYNPNLTQQDIKLSAFLRMNMSTKEIANLLNISVRGVEISRYRLRKKLDLSRDTNLADFMMNFNPQSKNPD